MRYLDTSSLVALYYPEPTSARLVALLTDRPRPLAYTWLHEVEFANGLHLKLFRKEASLTSVNATLNHLRGDAASGVLQWMHPSWPTVFSDALRLAVTHSRALGTRTLDLFHVAAALALRADEFVTGDARQAKVAAKEGLRVVRLT